MKHAITLSAFLALAPAATAQITLECDYSSPENRGQPMHYHWGVSNRISPTNGFKMPVSEPPLLNIVRPLGGKSRNGKKLIDEDTCKWNGSRHVYDWAPLKRQIDTVREKAVLYQLLIDNPPWAFQRGIDLKGGDEVETYGNAWPPNDPAAWSRYVQAMLKELVNTYGREEVGKWRFCIGREIGTKGHWRGSRLEFFEHYRSTERAIRSVLPQAKVGTHFLWASSKYSFGPDFVKWCKRNRVHYDFIGVSYYPFYNREDRVDLEHVYKVDFAPIKDIPEWNPSATLEIHEFALISKMSARGNSFDNAPKAHQEAFTVMLANMMYHHDMRDIYRWGTGANKIAEATFLGMKGNRYYRNARSGKPLAPGNMIDAVFAHDEDQGQFNIMIANYNADPKAATPEGVRIKTTLPVPPGTTIRFRSAIYEDDRLSWSDWKPLKTAAAAGTAGSNLELSIDLAPFSFQRIELNTPENVPLQSHRVKRVLSEFTSAFSPSNRSSTVLPSQQKPDECAGDQQSTLRLDGSMPAMPGCRVGVGRENR